MKKYFPSSILSFILVFVGAFVLTFVVAVILNLFSDVLSDIRYAPTIIFCTFSLFAFLIILAVNLLHHTPILSYYSVSNFSGVWIALLIIILFNVFINKPLSGVMPGIMHHDDGVALTESSSLLYVLGAVLLAPLLEETLFRGCLVRGFLERYSPKKAVLYSSVLFALVHVEPNQMFSALFIGCFVGFIFYKTRNLFYTMFLHTIANGSILLLSYYNPIADINGYILIIMGIVISVFLYYLVKMLASALN